MSVSKKIVNILNQEGVPTESVVDIFTNWRKLSLNSCDMKPKIKAEKERLIRYSDHDESEDTIGILMDLEINQEDHKYNQETLQRRIDELEGVIEHLVDNYDIDLRDFDTKGSGLRNFGHGGTLNKPKQKKIITDEMWLEATKQRRREDRLGELLDKKSDDGDNTYLQYI